MRVLITGANGFVGPHLINCLRDRLPEGVEILATAKQSGEAPSIGPIKQLDITDRDAVRQMIADFGCTHIVHLAGLTAVTAAAANPLVAWQVNVEGTLNIANGILQEQPDCKLIYIGSGQVYGMSARNGPIDEHALLDPVDSYSVTKAAADLAVGALAKQGLGCVRMRPFNHTGLGQTESFVVPSLAMQIARIEAGLQPAVIGVGNLDAERDFLDVRDVANAYVLALMKSHELPSGKILNVASGEGQSIRSILDRLLAMSDLQIHIEKQPGRMRPNDLPSIVGNATEARRLLNWAPEFSLDDTLSALLEDCRNRVASSGRTAILPLT